MKKYNTKELTHKALIYCVDNEFEVEWSKGITFVLVPENHIEQVKEHLSRQPLDFPTLKLNKDISEITKFTMSDIELINYKSHEPIRAPMAI
jgi:thymidylate synthase